MQNDNYYGFAMLNRAIIDHIPPVFALKTVRESYFSA
jgi:hypothetical protein